VQSIIQDDPERFDEETEGEVSTLIEFKDFITFILAPLTAALLIAEDMNVDLAEVHDIRDNSNEFGDVMQPDDDRDEQVDVPHRVDTLHRENIRVMTGTANTFFTLPPPRRQKNSEVVVFSLRYVRRLNLGYCRTLPWTAEEFPAQHGQYSSRLHLF
jgi:hypothetical protein